jgi:hypothetical protein
VKRIAAVAALLVAMLAVPAAAMAGTGQGQFACPPHHRLSQKFTFDMASGSSTVYEVAGPTLAPPDQFSYAGSAYTIWSVNPGADSFTMSLGASLFVNDGPAITDATGYLFCSA